MITIFGKRINPATGKAMGATRKLLTSYYGEKRRGDIIALWEGDFIITDVRYVR